MNRFRQRNGRFRNNNYRGRRGGNHDQSSNANSTSNPRPTDTVGATAVVVSEGEQGFGEDTFASWQEMKELEEEEDYMRFCLLKDKRDSENY